MAPICANKSDRKSYMNEIDGFSVLLTFPKPKANRSRKRRQFHDFFTFTPLAARLEFAACALPGKKCNHA